MKRKGIRKYNNGTSGVSVQSYMQSPADVIAENDIMMAQAELEAQNNPWTKGIEIGSSLLSSVASSGALAEGLNPNGKSFNEFLGGTPKVVANGSSGIQGNQAEVEGEEAFEAPNGQVGEFKGPSHEQGGMDMDIVPANQPITEGSLPEKTKIYSDRIIKDGKKLSDKKLDRDKKLTKLEKMLEGSTDIALKNAVQRKISSLNRQDQEDLQFQELATTFDEMAKSAFAPQGQQQEFANGTSGVGMWDGVQQALKLLQDAKNLGGDTSEEIDFTPTLGDEWKAFGQETNNSEVDSSIFNKIVGPYSDTQGNTITPEGFVAPKEKKSFDEYLPKAGDLVGQIGNIVSTFGPMKNTLENRAGDSPNINAYKDFGKDSLETLKKAGEGIGAERDISRQRLLAQARASKKAGRSGARGINQVRAMDMATDMGTNQADQNIDLGYAKQVMDLLNKKAGVQSSIDQVVMGGEQAKDLANRQDRDNFYTQMGKDISTKGQGIQTIGKDMNQIAMNPQVLKLLQQLGKYVSYDSKGNLIAKKTE